MSGAGAPVAATPRAERLPLVDVLKAVALGAKAVLLGRPVLWGLAVNGEAGVGAVLELLRREIDVAMALSGARNISELTRDLVVCS